MKLANKIVDKLLEAEDLDWEPDPGDPDDEPPRQFIARHEAIFLASLTTPGTFIIRSSHADFDVNQDGKVLGREITPDGEADYAEDIVRFDLDEWRLTYRADPCVSSTDYWIRRTAGAKNVIRDILDFGYWLRNGAYEPPEQEWRREIGLGGHEK